MKNDTRNDLLELMKINNYREACKYLQEKYDRLGYIRKDYYTLKPGNTTLTKTAKGYKAEGLQYHHICEDLIAKLSDRDIAIRNDLSYQKAENLCYCNLLEHLYLHYLITEETDGIDLGINGCAFILYNIMEALAKPDKDEGYNYNYIISNNADIIYRLINLICTSAIIKSKLHLSTDALYTRLGLDSYEFLDRLALTKTFLKEHNIEAFAEAEAYLKTAKSVILQICTCGGKTTSGLEYCRLHKVKALVLTPGNTVQDSWTDKKYTEYVALVMNYQTFMNCYATIDYSKFGIIICDEVHHADAVRWGEGLQYILNTTDLKILGLTATPTVLQTNEEDRYFGGRICYGLDLAEGIKEDIFWGFDYYQSIFEIESIEEECLKYGEKGKLLYSQLELAHNLHPIANILQENMPGGVRKCIVFISCKEDEAKAKKLIYEYSNKDARYQSEEFVRFISSDKDTAYNEAARKWFNEDSDHDKFIITVGMINEGAHYDGVNTAIMLRKTDSITLYLQQLGRVIRPKKDRYDRVVENPHGVVFDFTNNIENLIVNSQFNRTTTPGSQSKQREQLENIVEALTGKAYIVEDYSEDIVKKLAALKESNNNVMTQHVVYSLVEDFLANDDISLDDLLLADWDEVKTKNKQGNISVTGKQMPMTQSSGGNEQKFTDSKEKSARNKTIATKPEQLYLATKLILNRANITGVIQINSEDKTYIKVLNDDLFDKEVKRCGITKPRLFRELVKKFTLSIIWNLIEVF